MLHSSRIHICQSVINSAESLYCSFNLIHRSFPIRLHSLPEDTKSLCDESLSLLSAFLVSTQPFSLDTSPIQTLFRSIHQFSILLNLSIAFSDHPYCSIDLVRDLIFILQSASQLDQITRINTPSIIPQLFPFFQQSIENTMNQESPCTWLDVSDSILQSFDRLNHRVLSNIVFLFCNNT